MSMEDVRKEKKYLDIKIITISFNVNFVTVPQQQSSLRMDSCRGMYQGCI